MTSAADGDTAVSEPVRDLGPGAAASAAPASIFAAPAAAGRRPAGAAPGVEDEVAAVSEEDAAPAGELEESPTAEAAMPTVQSPAADPAPVTVAADEPVAAGPAQEEAEPVTAEPATDEAEGSATGGTDPAAEDVVLLTLQGPPSARLAQLGITLPEAPAPVAAYVPAVRTGDLVFTSGQLPFVDGALPLSGSVGDLDLDISPDEAAALARQCALNALAAVAGLVDLDRVVRVVKVVVYVASAPGFAGQPQVANGASTVLEQVFGDNGRHARSAVGVSALPMRSPVEVEVVVQVATDA